MTDYISRAEAIAEIRNTYEYEYPTASGALDEFATVIVPNILRNLPGGGWIPVSERLPEECTSVLAYNAEFSGPYGDIVVAYYRQGYWYGCKGLGMTHWMPLPEPPKEVE